MHFWFTDSVQSCYGLQIIFLFLTFWQEFVGRSCCLFWKKLFCKNYKKKKKKRFCRICFCHISVFFCLFVCFVFGANVYFDGLDEMQFWEWKQSRTGCAKLIKSKRKYFLFTSLTTFQGLHSKKLLKFNCIWDLILLRLFELKV
jgi:hypothetical protein